MPAHTTTPQPGNVTTTKGNGTTTTTTGGAAVCKPIADTACNNTKADLIPAPSAITTSDCCAACQSKKDCQAWTLTQDACLLYKAACKKGSKKGSSSGEKAGGNMTDSDIFV